MNSPSYRFIFNFALLIIWMGIIFCFSSFPGGGDYGFDWIVFLERKSAHIVEYFILTILFFRILDVKLENNKIAYAVSGAFVFSYAVSDEIHQHFVFGRSAKISDVVIDLLGFSLAAVSIHLYKTRKTK